jgi:putative transposase
MKQKRHTTEEIIRILRQAEGGKNVEAVCREHNVTATSYYRWKKKYGGMELQDARRYPELQLELVDRIEMSWKRLVNHGTGSSHGHLAVRTAGRQCN